MIQVKHILEKLNGVRSSLDIAMHQNINVFGADVHKWIHDCPIAVEELEKIEDYFGVTLPAEYRLFLLNITDGGAGPSLGLKSLAEATDWKMKNAQKDILRRPFLYASIL